MYFSTQIKTDHMPNNPEQILRKYMHGVSPLTDKQWAVFYSKFKKVTYDKQTVIAKKGEIYDSYYFLCKGILYMHDYVNGKDTTLNLIAKERFMTDVVSMTEKSPSLFNLTAIGKSTVLILKRSDFEELTTSDIIFERLARKLMERFFHEGIRRMNAILFMKPEERYLQVMKESPELVSFVAQRYLASFFNMTPQSFSRLKRRLFTKKKTT